MNFSELIQSKQPVLVDFFAEWCGPCKAMAPILTEVKRKIGDDVTIIKIDVDKNQQAAGAYQVQSIPTLMLFKEGKIIWKKVGMASATELEKVILANSK